MYIKVDLSSQLFSEIAGRINADDSRVRPTDRKGCWTKCNTVFIYDVFSFEDDLYFGVSLFLFSNGSVFAYCGCGFPWGERCRHIDEALLFHQKRAYDEIEEFFGAEVAAEELKDFLVV